MLSGVIISGYLMKKPKKNELVRVLLTQSNYQDGTEIKEYHIPLIYWTRDNNNQLCKMSEGTYLIVKGRVESSEEIGVYILVEEYQILSD